MSSTKLAGWQRDHRPTTEHPFTVIFVDEVAFLTAGLAGMELNEMSGSHGWHRSAPAEERRSRGNE
jgi:hypothetical protein